MWDNNRSTGWFGAQRHTAEAFGLAVGSVFVELDFDEIVDSQAQNDIGNVGIRGPPC